MTILRMAGQCKLLHSNKITMYKILVVFVVSCIYLTSLNLSDASEGKTTKNPLFMTEIDVERILDQWEDNDEVKLPEDELPPYKRKPKVQVPNLGSAFSSPEALMKAAKKGKTMMAFVTVAGNPLRHVTEELTGRWQLGLTNGHIKCQRYIIEDNKAIFLFDDGSQAYEAKEFLLEQPELKEYSIENQVFHGKGYPVDYPNANKDQKSDGKDEL